MTGVTEGIIHYHHRDHVHRYHIIIVVETHYRPPDHDLHFHHHSIVVVDKIHCLPPDHTRPITIIISNQHLQDLDHHHKNNNNRAGGGDCQEGPYSQDPDHPIITVEIIIHYHHQHPQGLIDHHPIHHQDEEECPIDKDQSKIHHDYHPDHHHTRLIDPSHEHQEHPLRYPYPHDHYKKQRNHHHIIIRNLKFGSNV